MNAVAYCYTPKSKGNQFSIQDQKEEIQNYCAQNGIEIIRWYIDEGIDDTKEHRSAFDRILQGEVTNPPVDYVIIAKTDCISCDVNLYYYYKALLSKHNVKILSVAEDWNKSDKITATILENFLAVVATMEREYIRIRTSGGRNAKAKAGGYAGGRPPYGYVTVGGRLVVDDKEAEAVRMIFNMKDSGATFQRICDAVNNAGYVTKSGGQFAISTLQVIINNRPIYEGKYRYGKGSDWVEGEQEAILDVQNIGQHADVEPVPLQEEFTQRVPVKVKVKKLVRASTEGTDSF